MIISHIKLSLFKQSPIIVNWIFYISRKPVVYIINRKIHGCLEIPNLFLVLNMIFLTCSLRSLAREISRSTLEIYLVFISSVDQIK